MAASGFTPIQLYYSTTNGNVPSAGNLAFGELAVNAYNGKLYYKNSNTGVVSVLADGAVATGNLPGGSTGSVVYQSSTGVTAYLPIAGASALLYSNGTLPAYSATGTAGSIVYSTGSAPAYASIGAVGSIVYSNGTTPTSLPIGTVDYVLTSTGSAPQWSPPSSVVIGTATNLAGGATGSVPYQSGVSTTTFLGLGSLNQVMTAGASGPTYVNQSTLSVGTATNLAGGTANQLAYQTGAGATSFVTAPSTANYVLTWSGSAFTWASVPSVTSAGNLLGGAAGDLVYQSATNASAFLSDVATGNALISGGVGVAPSYGKIGLTTHVSGTLPIANGGTNSTSTPTAGAVAYGTGTAFAFSTSGSPGEVLYSNGASAPTWGAAPVTPASKLYFFGQF